MLCFFLCGCACAERRRVTGSTTSSTATVRSRSSRRGDGSRRLVYSTREKLSSTMSGLDSNPFVDPVDVNPFQVSAASLSFLA